MARQNVGYLYKLSPRNKTPYSLGDKSAFKTSKNVHKQFKKVANENKKGIETPPSTYARFAHLKSRVPLQAIREESAERDQAIRDRLQYALESRDSDARGAIDHDEFMLDADPLPPDWDGDEESTLLNWLQHEPEDISDQTSLLVNSLQGPFSNMGKTLKEDLSQTLIPSAKRVKQIHEAILDGPFQDYGNGLLEFDDACKKMEALASLESEKLESNIEHHKIILKDLFRRLEAAYETRARITDDFQNELETEAARTIAELSQVSVDIESTIAALEKKSKELEKSTGSSKKTTEKMIRDLMDKF